MAHDAEVTGVGIIDEGRLTYSGPVPIGGGHYAHELAHDRLEKAKERGEWAERDFTDACRSAGVRHTILREVGEPFAILIDQSRYHDLMIFGLRVCSSMIWYLIRRTRWCSWYNQASARCSPSQRLLPVNKVLISLQWFDRTAKANEAIRADALWPDAKLRIVTFEHTTDKGVQLVREAAEYCRAHGFETEEAFIPASAKDHLLPHAEAWGRT